MSSTTLSNHSAENGTLEDSTVNTTTEHNHYAEMGVHPGITTLASCVVIIFMLGIYLSMGSINSFIRRQRMRFRRGRRSSSGGGSNNLEMTPTPNQQPQDTDRQTSKDDVSVHITKSSTSRSSSSDDDALTYCKGGAMTDICNSTENGRSRSDTKVDSADKSRVMTSATSICAQLYANTKSLLNETNKCGLIADTNLSKDVEIPLISAC